MNPPMNKGVEEFYDEGFGSTLNTFNPYTRLSQIMPHHAWECGYVDAHGVSSKKPL